MKNEQQFNLIDESWISTHTHTHSLTHSASQNGHTLINQAAEKYTHCTVYPLVSPNHTQKNAHSTLARDSSRMLNGGFKGPTPVRGEEHQAARVRLHPAWNFTSVTLSSKNPVSTWSTSKYQPLKDMTLSTLKCGSLFYQKVWSRKQCLVSWDMMSLLCADC